MYIILTSKFDEYDALPDQGIQPVESYEYYFYERKKAYFTIAMVKESALEERVSIVEVGDRGTVNRVRLKFFEHFDTLEDAREELGQLVTFGTIDTRLERCA